MPFAATWMDLEIIRLSESSQTEKDKYHDTASMWNLKYDTNELVYKMRIWLMDIENQFMVTKGERGKIN